MGKGSSSAILYFFQMAGNWQKRPSERTRSPIAASTLTIKSPQNPPWRPDIPAKERIMLAKCANPTCSTPLVYLREGKIFMVESPQPKREVLSDFPLKPKHSNRVEHFWLCGPCSNEMTVTYDRHRGVEIIRKPVGKAPMARRAAAS
jgi:hypothetical protein